jgi:hypothetical protein
VSGVLVLICSFSMLVPVNVRAAVTEEQGAPVGETQAAAAGDAATDAGAQAVPAGETQAGSESETQAVAVTEHQGNSSGEPRNGFLGAFEINGYLRHYMSFNLQDVPETKGDDRFKMSMNRLSLLLQLKGPLGPANFTAIGRFSREQMTNYLRDLQNLARTTSNDVDFSSHYDENELREFYLDIPVGERIKLRLGKQQVVWGETDFFQAMDVVHGYDQSWRSFLEPENEEWRKPLILGNAQIAVPELKGTLQLLVRPGFDRDRDIGNTFDMFGGRWAQNGSKGFDLNSTNRPAGLPPTVPSLPFNFHHPEGDTDKAHYGGRWTGTLGKNDDLSYSLNYYHTQAQNPVLFPDASTAGNFGLSFIYPKIDIYGGTLSGKIPIDVLDTVFRAEAAYIPDQPYNNATFGVVKKDILRSMFGLDTNLRLEEILGTCNASMLSLQVFDTYILDHQGSDQIMNAFGTREKEHTTWMTGIFTLPYRSDTIKGQLVAVQDLSSNGGVFVPSVEFQIGAHWRLKVEADLFYGGKRSDAGNNASIFGSFANNDQFYTRLTYQF